MKTAQEKTRPKNSRAGEEWVPVLRLIARRADELWVQSGHSHGHDLEYWLQAETEVLDGNHSIGPKSPAA